MAESNRSQLRTFIFCNMNEITHHALCSPFSVQYLFATAVYLRQVQLLLFACQRLFGCVSKQAMILKVMPVSNQLQWILITIKHILM